MPKTNREERVDLADLKRKSVCGGAVTMGAQGARIVIQFVSIVVLARLLSPEDYGVIAMVGAVAGFAGLFRDLGLSSAAIQKKNLTRAQQSNLFWLNVAMGTLLTGVLAAASPLVAWFYRKPELVPVTLALSLSFLIGSFGSQHGALLVREMQFAREAVATISGAVVNLGVAITLGLQGFSYWSLVWGSLSGDVVTTLLLILLSPFRPGRPRRGTGIWGMLGFGANVTGFNVVNYFHRNLDRILLGRFAGSEVLGIYSRAYSLMMLPIQSIRQPISRVAFPAMSKLQNDPEAYRNYFKKLTGVVAFFSMPVAAFMFAASEEVVRVLLGIRWLAAAPILAAFAIAGFILPVASLRGVVMLSFGRGGAYFGWGLLNAVVVSMGFGVGIAWGGEGMALAYTVVNYLLLYPSLVIAFHGTAIRKRDFFSALARPGFASLFAGGGVWAILPWLPVSGGGFKLVLAGVLFGALYGVGMGFSAAGRQEMRRLGSLVAEIAPARWRANI